ncbi:hypothetical protein FS749_013994 [Ceratobasidium sp. UAMH 11750]|nr:hypothetical protein FS749_013994 [Ceratobasidium sp. UAMH 11750]
MHPIFIHFDLLHYIVQDLSPKDWLNLLRVSQLFLTTAAPLVWRKVEGVHNLLALLPHADIRLSVKHPKLVEYMDLDNTKSQNLTRFKFYAPFVKSLEIYGERSQEYEVEVAPEVRHLSLFIEGEQLGRPEEDVDMMGFWEPPLSGCFKNLPTLQAITSTEAMLGADVLWIVAGLPELKVLDIWMRGGFTEIWDELDPKSLPSNPFPALEHFCMRGADTDEVWTVLRHPLFGNLSSLRLSFHERPTREEAVDEPWEYQLIELIAQASPRLTSLNIEFDESHVYFELSDLLDPTSNGSSALDFQYSIRSDDLKLAWPLVTKLSMPRLKARFKELYKFSQLSSLQELTVLLDLQADSLEDNFFERPTGSSSLHTLRASTLMWPCNTEPDISAKALLHCWPNLERVVFHIGADDPPYRNYYNSRMSDMINEINHELQNFDYLKARVAAIRSKFQPITHGWKDDPCVQTLLPPNSDATETVLRWLGLYSTFGYTDVE